MLITRNKERRKPRCNKTHGKRITVGRLLLYALLALVIALPYLGIWLCREWYNAKVEEIDNAALILVNKEDMTLKLVDYRGKTLFSYGIACGKKYGNKTQRGDYKTPEGIFHISDIQDASTWKHDFGDGEGEIAGAYGPWFLRLEVPGHKGIGIHGTHKPESIGTRDTEGCIRLHNEDLQELKRRVFIGMTVIVLPSLTDLTGSMLLDSLQKRVNATETNSVRKAKAKSEKDAVNASNMHIESRKSRLDVLVKP